jgi:hypothetical protein
MPAPPRCISHRPNGRDRSALVVVLLGQFDQPMKSAGPRTEPQYLKFGKIDGFDVRLFQSGAERMIRETADFCGVGSTCA